MVLYGDYVLIRNKGATGPVELYNVVLDPSQENNLAALPEHAERVQQMRNLLVQCRIPIVKVPEACGAYGAYAVGNWSDVLVTPTSKPGVTPHGVDSLPMPSVAVTEDSPKFDVSLFLSGADAWPWVPNFRTMLPEAKYQAMDAGEIKNILPAFRPFGVAIRGWIDISAEQDITFTARGLGGCQLWLHEAHVLEYEVGDCKNGKKTSYKLAPGRHPFRLYLTTTNGRLGLCTVTAGALRII
jgi:hypothetical protein